MYVSFHWMTFVNRFVLVTNSTLNQLIGAIMSHYMAFVEYEGTFISDFIASLNNNGDCIGNRLIELSEYRRCVLKTAFTLHQSPWEIMSHYIMFAGPLLNTWGWAQIGVCILEIHTVPPLLTDHCGTHGQWSDDKGCWMVGVSVVGPPTPLKKYISQRSDW